MFGSNELTPELLTNVGKGLTNLSNTARGISDITSATLATDLYVKNLSSASESMNNFTEINNKANVAIDKSVEALLNRTLHLQKNYQNRELKQSKGCKKAGKVLLQSLPKQQKNLLTTTAMQATQ